MCCLWLVESHSTQPIGANTLVASCKTAEELRLFMHRSSWVFAIELLYTILYDNSMVFAAPLMWCNHSLAWQTLMWHDLTQTPAFQDESNDSPFQQCVTKSLLFQSSLSLLVTLVFNGGCSKEKNTVSAVTIPTSEYDRNFWICIALSKLPQSKKSKF